jgi:TonB family protein
MNKNLNIVTFRNGDSLFKALSVDDWSRANQKSIPAYMNYDFIESNGEIFGKLYNWYAVSDSRGLAPEGWHIPTIAEWRSLINELGPGNKASQLKSKENWIYYSGGDNETGFSAQPGGVMRVRGTVGYKEYPVEKGYSGYWWTRTQANEADARYFSIVANQRETDLDYQEYDRKGNGYSVRCIKDNESNLSNNLNTPEEEGFLFLDEDSGIADENSGIAPPVDIDQGKQIVEEKIDESIIFEKVEIEASFPGGDIKWRQYLERNANEKVATDNGAPEGTYTVVVQFVVDKEGRISDVRSLTNHGYGMEEEAMRAIKKGPKWSPAIHNGRQVKAYRKQPITFRVRSNKHS